MISRESASRGESDAEVQIDARAMARAFGAAATTYDSSAQLQGEVRQELLARVTELRGEPHVVIDLGAGTGAATPLLKQMFPRALVCAVDITPSMLVRAASRIGMLDRLWPWSQRRFECVGADARRLPFADGSVDLVFSNLMLQWCDDLDTVLMEIRRVLSPQGVFLFSSFGPTTLQELRGAWAAVDGYPHVNIFVDVHDLGAALSRSGFAEPVLDIDRLVRQYADVMALLAHLKAIGARNARVQRKRGLTGRSALRRMQEAYAQIVGRAVDVPATWEVVYGCAFAARMGTRRAAGSETVIPITRIGRR
jgi:malonyl-CoA O-methyltransferase